jgi:hypothetical protein
MQIFRNNKSSKNHTTNTKATLVLSLMPALLCLSLTIVGQAQAQSIPSSSSYTNAAGTYHVVGEVENNSTVNIDDVIVAGTFYDTDNKVVGTAFAPTLPFDIQSGQKAPFDMMVFDQGQVKNIHNYTLQTSHK